MTAAVTFDFHNTLFRCERWFELEVRTLPAVVHRALVGDAKPAFEDSLTDAYRTLRTEIIAHGHELEAIDGVVEAFRRVGLVVDAPEIGSIIDAAMSEALGEAELLPGAWSTVQFLRTHNLPIGIVSSAVHHQFVEWALSKFGLVDAFDVVVTSARAGYYKSRREIYDIALDALGARAACSVHVGDSYRFDHLAGKDVGMATVWVREPSSSQARNGSTPDLELSTLDGAGPAILELVRVHQDKHCAD